MQQNAPPGMYDSNSLLLTDLYQLTMLHSYYRERMAETATFELFFRDLPPERNFLVAAGLETALEFLEQAQFAPDELDWLAGLGRFPRDFIDDLADWRFTGDAHAVAEGTVVFPQEPVLRITAPLPQAQLVESRLINLIHLQTLIASKAARSVLAAPGKRLVDFGLRRAHGAEAGLLAARAAFIAGFDGTATVLAGQRFGLPMYGTMAHSFIQAHRDERSAFRAFAAAQPDNLVFLIDTYDTEAGARIVAELAPELRQSGCRINAVRLDSGNLGEHARRVRAILDDGGADEVAIFASGDLDEYALTELLATAAPIDGFGLGTRLDTSADRPHLDCAYKLTEYAGEPRRKRSERKASWPGRKQVWRRFDGHIMAGDIITLDGESADGVLLTAEVMRGGRRTTPAESTVTIRDRVATQLQQLPAAHRALETARPYDVDISAGVRQLADAADAALARHAPG